MLCSVELHEYFYYFKTPENVLSHDKAHMFNLVSPA